MDNNEQEKEKSKERLRRRQDGEGNGGGLLLAPATYNPHGNSVMTAATTSSSSTAATAGRGSEGGATPAPTAIHSTSTDGAVVADTNDSDKMRHDPHGKKKDEGAKKRTAAASPSGKSSAQASVASTPLSLAPAVDDEERYQFNGANNNSPSSLSSSHNQQQQQQQQQQIEHHHNARHAGPRQLKFEGTATGHDDNNDNDDGSDFALPTPGAYAYYGNDTHVVRNRTTGYNAEEDAEESTILPPSAFPSRVGSPSGGTGGRSDHLPVVVSARVVREDEHDRHHPNGTHDIVTATDADTIDLEARIRAQIELETQERIESVKRQVLQAAVQAEHVTPLPNVDSGGGDVDASPTTNDTNNNNGTTTQRSRRRKRQNGDDGDDDGDTNDDYGAVYYSQKQVLCGIGCFILIAGAAVGIAFLVLAINSSGNENNNDSLNSNDNNAAETPSMAPVQVSPSTPTITPTTSAMPFPTPTTTATTPSPDTTPTSPVLPPSPPPSIGNDFPFVSERFQQWQDFFFPISGNNVYNPSADAYQALMILYNDTRYDTQDLTLPTTDNGSSSSSSSNGIAAATTTTATTMALTLLNNEQYRLLVEIYIMTIFWVATIGTEWNFPNNFFATTNVCDWNAFTFRGVSCGDDGSGPSSSLYITSIQMNNNNLQGTIPNEIQYLLDLQIFAVGFNAMVGTLPGSNNNVDSDTGNRNLNRHRHRNTGNTKLRRGLQQQQQQDDNDVNDDILDWSNLSNLIDIQIQFNSFIGRIPSEIGTVLPNLQRFNTWGNQLTGPIPSFHGNVNQLQYLNFDGNSAITGNLVEFFTTTPTSLEEFWCSQCQLDGTIPGERLSFYINLRNLVLSRSIERQFDVDTGIEIFGTIPTQIGNLTNLEVLILTEGHLIGTIPTEMGMLQQLQILQLSFNDLTGSLPTEVSAMKNLREVQINWNDLTGTIPVGLASLPALEKLELIYNSLSGRIPWSFLQQQDDDVDESMNSIIKQLNLAGNEGIQDNLVDVLTNLPSTLEGFSCDLCNLTPGPIPDIFSKFTNLITFSLPRTNINGTIPESLVASSSSSSSSSSTLYQLSLQGNDITGTIPSSIADIVTLQTLELFDNSLHGPVPLFTGTDKEDRILSTINLNNNRHLRANLSELFLSISPEYLKSFWMMNTMLTGTIPTEIGLYQDLEYFAISSVITDDNNDDVGNVTGTLPTELAELNQLIYLWVDGNQLTGTVPDGVADLTRLASFRLNTNDIIDDLDADFCPRRGQLSELVADCAADDDNPPSQVICSCCSLCWSDEQNSFVY